MKKIEIVFPKSFLDELTEILNSLDISGYTILEVYKSYGKHYGASLNFGFSASQGNLYLFSICEKAIAESIINSISARIKEVGGIIVSSDVFTLDFL